VLRCEVGHIVVRSHDTFSHVPCNMLSVGTHAEGASSHLVSEGLVKGFRKKSFLYSTGDLLVVRGVTDALR
jgi:hypothetical protein